MVGAGKVLIRFDPIMLRNAKGHVGHAPDCMPKRVSAVDPQGPSLYTPAHRLRATDCFRWCAFVGFTPVAPKDESRVLPFTSLDKRRIFASPALPL